MRIHRFPTFAIAIIIGLAALEPVFAEDKETPEMHDLKSIEHFKSQFNADTGKRRLLLLLSPT
jgi:hypothetical protein